jgi:hypothetical protein
VAAQGEYIGGVKHEVSAQSAMRSMQPDLTVRYDLYVAPQPGKAIDPSEPLSIEVKSKSEIRTISEADDRICRMGDIGASAASNLKMRIPHLRVKFLLVFQLDIGRAH